MRWHRSVQAGYGQDQCGGRHGRQVADEQPASGRRRHSSAVEAMAAAMSVPNLTG